MTESRHGWIMKPSLIRLLSHSNADAAWIEYILLAINCRIGRG